VTLETFPARSGHGLRNALGTPRLDTRPPGHVAHAPDTSPGTAEGVVSGLEVCADGGLGLGVKVDMLFLVAFADDERSSVSHCSAGETSGLIYLGRLNLKAAGMRPRANLGMSTEICYESCSDWDLCSRIDTRYGLHSDVSTIYWA